MQTQLNEVFIAAFICAISVMFCSTYVLRESLNAKVECDSPDGKVACFNYISWELQVARVICACIFHFIFENEITTAMSLCKYVLLNKAKFRYPTIAFFMGVFQVVSIVYIEIIQSINLIQLSDYMDIL